MDFISIICPILNEEHFIETCIESILAQDYPAENMELLLVDGMSTDNTRRLADRYCREHKNIHLLDNPRQIVPCAMNIGIREAKGNIIVRIDAHSSFPKNYISTLVNNMNTLADAWNVGAVCRTLPRTDSDKARAIVAVLSNRFGIGNSAFRIGTKQVIQTDTVPFGCYRREVFDKVGLYNERLVRNQDIELNKRIKQHGGKIYLIPDTYCTYYARSSYRELAHNNFQNGKWNILTLYYTKNTSSLSLRHFIPLLFVLSLVIPLPAMLIWAPLGLIAAFSLLIYLLLTITVSIIIAKKQGINVGYIWLSFIVLHISYGIGSLCGILQLPFVKS